MDVSVFGCGYVGCVTAACLASRGHRVVGVDVNPYLAIAVGLTCGYLGVVKAIEPGPPEAGEPDEDDYPIPLTIDEALTIFEEASDIHEILGEYFCMIFDEVKREEMRLFHREISPWEREHLLLEVQGERAEHSANDVQV